MSTQAVSLHITIKNEKGSFMCFAADGNEVHISTYFDSASGAKFDPKVITAIFECIDKLGLNDINK